MKLALWTHNTAFIISHDLTVLNASASSMWSAGKNECLSKEIKIAVLKNALLLILLYKRLTYVKENINKLNAMGVYYFRNVCDESRWNWITNECVLNKCGLNTEISNQYKRNSLRWFGDMDEWEKSMHWKERKDWKIHGFNILKKKHKFPAPTVTASSRWRSVFLENMSKKCQEYMTKKIYNSSRTIQYLKLIPTVHIKQTGTYTEQQQYRKILEEKDHFRDSHKGIILILHKRWPHG